MKHLLIVYHSKEGSTGKMAKAVYAGANHPDVDVKVRMLLAADAGVDDLLWADGLLLGTPENFGYMSGALKDFFDRTYYPTEGKLQGLPYSIFISAGNDGTGALSSIRRICTGYAFKEVQEPVIKTGELDDECLEACEALGTYLAAGIESSIF